MVNAVTYILRSLGEDPLREELLETLIRFVKWLMNFRNTDFEMKLHGIDCYRINLFKSNRDVKHNITMLNYNSTLIERQSVIENTTHESVL